MMNGSKNPCNSLLVETAVRVKTVLYGKVRVTCHRQPSGILAAVVSVSSKTQWQGLQRYHLFLNLEIYSNAYATTFVKPNPIA
jgi:hypothetical protein